MSYSDKKVDGWFLSTRTEKSKVKVTAMFFFSDKTMIVSTHSKTTRKFLSHPNPLNPTNIRITK